ncbi:hypothetical protein HA052_24175 [Chromobacterium haemolyticum]|uniref:Uncharacterized protein n=1 Tax=Chromobacterium fluminis TaxID=3044269 RepID=A0ABX0LFG1_9NEIS|nr:hypothetical protein [Chromobacterium haemolyticum]NHR08294.1 hypothetical protein [Chromobacterium haemolyticum]OQS41876.1 hypothetical protein B0T39_08065 [Chromobacterium haemolyticum]
MTRYRGHALEQHLRVNELKPGDYIAEQHDSAAITFTVIAVNAVGRHCHITFSSELGLDSASYPHDAWINAARP